MSKSTVDEFRDLTDTDVEILYSIVTTAQDSGDPPFRALFAAYDKVLAKQGIRKDHDRTYFRFLLRMGEARSNGQTLFEQFESLLTKLGFQLDFSDDEQDNQDNTTDHSEGDRPMHIEQNPREKISRSRRASFDSAYPKRPFADASRHEKGYVSPTRSYTMDTAQPTPKKPSITDNAYQGISDTLYKSHGREAALPSDLRGRLSERDFQGSINPERARSANGLDRNDFAHARKQIADLSANVDDSLSNYRGLQSPVEMYGDDPYSHISVDAETFSAHHTAIASREIMRQWLETATRRNQRNSQMYKQATTRDRETLLRQAFDQWNSVYKEKRQLQETDKFFEHLEKRAGRARDLFLLTKAFTHWAQCAADEALRTSVAKRHVIRNRYFNAWRDFAVVNELKVRRVRLAKFFGIWRRRTNQILEHSDNAYLLDESRLIERCYRLWFWHFCERRAPLWSGENLKIKILKRWHGNFRDLVNRRLSATNLRETNLARKVISVWRCRLALSAEYEELATSFRRKKLMKFALQHLRKETTFAPLTVRLEQLVDSRVARTAITKWIDRTRLVLHAAQVDRLRLMRNAWTTWNDRLRCEALARNIDDRVTIEALYKWVLAERAMLCERITAQRLKQKAFKRWAMRFNNLCTNLGRSELLFREYKDSKLARSSMSHWSQSEQDLHRSQQQAIQFRNVSLTRQAIQRWRSRLRAAQMLQSWSEDARFFSLSIKSIKKWGAAMQTNKRRKRRDAYAAVRRKVKMNMARNLVSKWRTSLEGIRNMHSQADKAYGLHLLLVERTLFVEWQRKSAELIQADQQAYNLYRERLQHRCFHCLVVGFAQVQDLIVQAAEFDRGMVEANAATLLRKMNWQLFQVRRQQETATSLEDRNSKKHYRNMIRYWASKTSQRRHPPTVWPSSSTEPVTRRAEDHGDDGFQRAAILTGFEDADLNSQFVDADVAGTPGYLRTPSKRTSKMRARFQTPRTPATTQITPYSRRSGLQGSTNAVLSARGDFAQRLRGFVDSSIDDIPESSS